ncbi:hypothetical protein HYH03_015583 [Edaphochlamys debaryana]|uniref:Uncharacterized protein n=1 Tax=Edaphochlamys debaryana TaxID=47281 RepID=A0A836BSF4_9CHLO|nr:hypothetical protein HYH03_015583 [Edaphochlamys debaryana]|eukprot:KAG2485698.1 hypothetical protein HYH03_015583 [Edaphochlamys debaryana]
MGQTLSSYVSYYIRLWFDTFGAVHEAASKDELADALKGFEDWEKYRRENPAPEEPKPNPTTGTLFHRVGGSDKIKRIVELFCRKLYANQRFKEQYFHDVDIIRLRAKQVAFCNWLFGPASVPYGGRPLRLSHLRSIRQRELSPDDFEVGMQYFLEAMGEAEVPERIAREIMSRLRPFKTSVFMSSQRDADEEARWASEERMKELQALVKAQQAKQEARDREAKEKKAQEEAEARALMAKELADARERHRVAKAAARASIDAQRAAFVAAAAASGPSGSSAGGGRPGSPPPPAGRGDDAASAPSPSAPSSVSDVSARAPATVGGGAEGAAAAAPPPPMVVPVSPARSTSATSATTPTPTTPHHPTASPAPGPSPARPSGGSMSASQIALPPLQPHHLSPLAMQPPPGSPRQALTSARPPVSSSGGVAGEPVGTPPRSHLRQLSIPARSAAGRAVAASTSEPGEAGTPTAVTPSGGSFNRPTSLLSMAQPGTPGSLARISPGGPFGGMHPLAMPPPPAGGYASGSASPVTYGTPPNRRPSSGTMPFMAPPPPSLAASQLPPSLAGLPPPPPLALAPMSSYGSSGAATPSRPAATMSAGGSMSASGGLPIPYTSNSRPMSASSSFDAGTGMAAAAAAAAQALGVGSPARQPPTMPPPSRAGTGLRASSSKEIEVHMLPDGTAADASGGGVASPPGAGMRARRASAEYSRR